MARIKIQDIVEDKRTEFRRALEAAVEEAIPGAEFDTSELYRAFRRAIGRKCSTWERVPDHYVEKD